MVSRKTSFSTRSKAQKSHDWSWVEVKLNPQQCGLGILRRGARQNGGTLLLAAPRTLKPSIHYSEARCSEKWSRIEFREGLHAREVQGFPEAQKSSWQTINQIFLAHCRGVQRSCQRSDDPGHPRQGAPKEWNYKTYILLKCCDKMLIRILKLLTYAAWTWWDLA